MQLTPQASLGFCEIVGDIGVRIRKKGKMRLPCVPIVAFRVKTGS